jgi:cation diffusion facilitator family transporter
LFFKIKNMPERTRLIKRASYAAFAGNAILAVLKIVAGIISGSLAVVADGIDSTGDVLISVITLYTASLIARPPDIKYPYGYGKAEPIATKALSFILFFAGIQLIMNSTQKLIHGKVGEIPTMLAVYIIGISIAGKIGLALYQYKIGKKTKSRMLMANGKNMQADVMLSSSVLVGLGLTHLLHLPLIDKVMTILLGLWIIKVAYGIFMETNFELMDRSAGKEIYEKVFETIEKIKGVKNPHRVRIRKIGNNIMIAVDLEMNGNLTLHRAHQLSHEVEVQLKNDIDDVFDVAIHIEPFGDKIEEKIIGISKANLEQLDD